MQKSTAFLCCAFIFLNRNGFCDHNQSLLTDILFVYLGSIINSTGYTPESRADILRRIALASSVIGQLDGVWHQPAESHYQAGCWECIYYMCPGSRPSGCWNLDTVERQRLQAFHN